MLGSGVIIGIVSGLVLGLFAFIASLIKDISWVSTWVLYYFYIINIQVNTNYFAPGVQLRFLYLWLLVYSYNLVLEREGEIVSAPFFKKCSK